MVFHSAGTLKEHSVITEIDTTHHSDVDNIPYASPAFYICNHLFESKCTYLLKSLDSAHQSHTSSNITMTASIIVIIMIAIKPPSKWGSGPNSCGWHQSKCNLASHSTLGFVSVLNFDNYFQEFQLNVDCMNH